MNFLRKYFSQLIFLLIGFLAGFFVSRLPITFDEKISPIAFATFFLTILLALYLEFKVRPSLTNTRNEKDILIDLLTDVKAKLSEINDLYMTSRAHNPVPIEEQTDILSKLRDLSNTIALLKSTDEYCKMYQKLKISNRVVVVYLAYKKAITGNKFNEPNFSFDRLHWKSQEQTYRQHMKVIMESIIDINKAR